MRRRQWETLHCRSWYRSLYVGMRRDERFIARQQRWLARMRPHIDDEQVASHGRLVIAYMRHIDQSWRFLQPEPRRA